MTVSDPVGEQERKERRRLLDESALRFETDPLFHARVVFAERFVRALWPDLTVAEGRVVYIAAKIALMAESEVTANG